jgi:hypothetical protein
MTVRQLVRSTFCQFSFPILAIAIIPELERPTILIPNSSCYLDSSATIQGGIVIPYVPQFSAIVAHPEGSRSVAVWNSRQRKRRPDAAQGGAEN